MPKPKTSTPRARTAAPHFTPELFRFLRQLERNNNREWFNKNKDRYLEVVRDPLLRFIEDLGPRLRKVSPNFVADPRPTGGSMFRIYRDVRFSRDKKPYKTAATARFQHVQGKDVHAPGFYLHLGTDGVYAGTGIWHPDGPALRAIRERISENPGSWKRVLNHRTVRPLLPLTGEFLQRPPRGFDPEHPFIEDLKRKDFITMSELTEEQACAPGFLDRFTGICRDSKPFVKFLTEAVGLTF